MLTINEFLQIIPGGIAIYGIDGGGIATDIYLRQLGLNAGVQFFMAPPNPRHTRFCGKPVTTLEHLRAYPEISVVTANLDFVNIHDTMRAMGLKNDFYYHASFWPFMDDEMPQYDAQTLNGLYDNADAHTVVLAEALDILRYKANICRIQPYAAVKNILYAEDAYWLGQHMLNEPELTIIDAGAFNGDTMLSLFKTYGQRIKRYHAFEPMPHIFPRLRQTAMLFPGAAKVECHNMALYSQNTALSFHKGVPRSSHVAAQGDVLIQCRKLDELELAIDGKACLKMDIEGSEMEALKGAANFIQTHRPHLALCIYHKTNDICTIPQFLKALNPQYRFTLSGGVHTLCYGKIQN